MDAKELELAYTKKSSEERKELLLTTSILQEHLDTLQNCKETIEVYIDSGTSSKRARFSD